MALDSLHLLLPSQEMKAFSLCQSVVLKRRQSAVNCQSGGGYHCFEDMKLRVIIGHGWSQSALEPLLLASFLGHSARDAYAGWSGRGSEASPGLEVRGLWGGYGPSDRGNVCFSLN